MAAISLKSLHAKTHQIASVFSDQRKLKIGIFGGSFNPAHEGHAHLADMAIRQLQLDEVWWLVSPQNPLKSSQDMAQFSHRFDNALMRADRCSYRHRMRVSDLEYHLGLQHSSETLKQIRLRCPNASFVWIMGSDNLASFHLWHNPQSISQSMAIAVVNRPGSVYSALSSRGAKRAGQLIKPAQMRARQLPAGSWTFLRGSLNSQSATALRALKT